MATPPVLENFLGSGRGEVRGGFVAHLEAADGPPVHLRHDYLMTTVRASRVAPGSRQDRASQTRELDAASLSAVYVDALFR
jgi:hypothetical protein